MLTLRNVLRGFSQYFFHPSALTLLGLLLALMIAFFQLGSTLTPFWVAIFLAYLLEKPTAYLEKIGLKRSMAALLIVGMTIIGFILVSLLIPRGVQQLQAFLQEMGRYSNALYDTPVVQTHAWSRLQAELINQLHKVDWHQAFLSLVQGLIKPMLNVIPSCINVILNIALVPFLLFFCLKDKVTIQACCIQYLPADPEPLLAIYHSLKWKLECYLKNRLLELILMWFLNLFLFRIQGLHYSCLLGFLVGLGTVVPYFGFAIATFLVAMATFTQMGCYSKSIIFFSFYLCLQAIDKTIIYTLLSSEAAQLHPLTILFAILVCGEWFGFWGLIFAVPIAISLKTLWLLWPVASDPLHPIRSSAD